jgi:predicted porin
MLIYGFTQDRLFIFLGGKKMVKHKKLSMAVAGACALLGASAANAFGPIKAGDWDLSVSGEVNAFVVKQHCDTNGRAVAGGLACASFGPSSEQASQTDVASGLLPSALVFSAKTTQEGFDIGVTFGFYPTIDNTPNNSQGSNSSINMRQNFLTFGDKEMGTIKMGRDLGLFGSDAILSDVTLLGVGSPATALGGGAGPTTLGRIGTGYIYADWIPQVTYITPSFDGFQLSAGVFQPLQMVDAFNGITASNHAVPQFQVKGTYDFKVSEDIKNGRVWGSGIWQRSTVSNADGGPFPGGYPGVAAYAGDIGIKANVYDFEPVIYYYQGRGIGTTLLFLNGFDGTGQQRNSRGGYGQISHAFGKWKPSFSYGISYLYLGSGEANNPGSASTLVHSNKMRVQQLQYSLTKALTLVEEFSTTRSNCQGGGDPCGQGNYSTAISLGAILFF